MCYRFQTCLHLQMNIYHHICISLPRNTTLGGMLCMKACAWYTGVSPSGLLCSQETFTHTSIGIAPLLHNSKQGVQIVSMNYSLLIRHYYRNPFQFLVLHILICLNSARLKVQHHAQCMAPNTHHRLLHTNMHANIVCIRTCAAHQAPGGDDLHTGSALNRS